jgi:hypothetical protein
VTTPGPDERAQVTPGLPPLDAVIEVDAAVLATRLVSLPDEANALLRLLDGRRTLREVIAGSGQDEIEAASVLARLHELGVLCVGTSAAGASAVATPAPEVVEWFAEPEDATLAVPPRRAGEVEPEPHGPADAPDESPGPGGGWVRDMLARLRR